MHDAIVVVSFGGPEGPDDVMPFLENVTRGRGIPPERLAEVARHYLDFGGVSPINAQNRALVAALQQRLAERGRALPVYWGNRNWHPYLYDTVARIRDDGVRHAAAFVTSAFSSYSACRQYLDDIAAARAAVGEGAPTIDKLRQFGDHPGFVAPFVDNVRAALDALEPEQRSRARLVFSAHSIPSSMAATCDYEAQLRDSARLVADAVGHDEWDLVWQSRSGPPSVPWLGPDIADHLDDLADRGVDVAVSVPIGFVSDHLEVVYDLDIVAAAKAAERGIAWQRAATPGTDPRFVAMVIELLDERDEPAAPRRHLGRLGVRPDQCPAGCCPPPVRPAAGGRPGRPA